jgi:2-keto-4-pentenoate hydratase
VTLPLSAVLVAQRSSRVLIDSLPDHMAPVDLAAAYQVQTETVHALGPIGAWKVAPYPESGEPLAAPIPISTVFPDKTVLDAAHFPAPAIEAEIAVTLNRDLPARETPYNALDLTEAIGTLHLAIEVLSSRFADPAGLSLHIAIADLQNNAGVVLGPARAMIELPELGQQPMKMSVDGTEIGRVPGGSTTETMLLSLAWLANHAAARGLALKQGDVIITGARIGALPLHGKTVLVASDDFEPVTVSFQ